MTTTDTTEKGLESLIVAAMAGSPVRTPPAYGIAEPTVLYGGTGWILGLWQDYDREYAVDLVQLGAFLDATQPVVASAVDLEHDSPIRRKFLARLQGEITKRGVIDVLRHGVKHGPHAMDLFYGTPSPGNAKAAAALIQQGALVDGADAEGCTPLMRAVMTNHAEVAKVLLDHGANPDVIVRTDSTPLYPLFVAAVSYTHLERSW